MLADPDSQCLTPHVLDMCCTSTALQGSQQYINLEEEYRRAERHVCTACGYTGAAIGCTEPG